MVCVPCANRSALCVVMLWVCMFGTKYLCCLCVVGERVLHNSHQVSNLYVAASLYPYS